VSEIKTGMGIAKTPCYKTSLFSAETAKRHIEVYDKLLHAAHSFNYRGTQGIFSFN